MQHREHGSPCGNEGLMKKRTIQLTFWYLIFYALYSISTRFVPTAILCKGTPADLLYKTVIIAGGVLALLFLIHLADRIKPNIRIGLLAAFIVILGISTVLNREYEFAGNILGMATFVSQLIVFYFLPYLMPEEWITSCVKWMGLVTSLFWTPGCAVSLYQYIWNIHYRTLNPEDRIIRQGIIDGRLFGLFSDPNFAAFTSLLIIFLLVFVIRQTSSKFVQIYSIVCIVINLAYLIMSNSRTIYIAAVGAILFFVLLTTYKKYKAAGGDSLKQLLPALCKKTGLTLLAIVAVYAVIFFPIQGIGHLVVTDRNLNDMIREDVTTENITNNRSTIWKNYMKLYKDKPVFGFSIRSALPYAEDKYPGSYLAITKYVTHNGYISLLIETGITGFLVMGAFFLLTFLQSLKRLRTKEKISDTYTLFAVLTVAVLIFLMCFHDVFFTVNIETMLLFIGVGYMTRSNQTFLNQL